MFIYRPALGVRVTCHHSDSLARSPGSGELPDQSRTPLCPLKILLSTEITVSWYDCELRRRIDVAYIGVAMA
jgi:hypothetical protein